MLREEANTIRIESNNTRNEIKILKEEAEAIKNRSKLPKTDGKTTSQILIEEDHTISNNSKEQIGTNR